MKSRLSNEAFHKDVLEILTAEAKDETADVSFEADEATKEFEKWTKARGFFIPNYPETSPEVRSKLCQLMINPSDKEKPVIMDIGSGECSLYYMLLDYLPHYTYLGIDRFTTPGILDFEKAIKKNHAGKNFDFLNSNIKAEDISDKIKKITGADKVDFIFLEDFATVSSDNPQTDKLLKYIIENFIPRVLSESGSFHIKSASQHQDKIISDILKSKNLDFIAIGGSFICGKAALVDKIILAAEETLSHKHPGIDITQFFNINSPPKYKKAATEIEHKETHTDKFFKPAENSIEAPKVTAPDTRLSSSASKKLPPSS